MGIRTIEINHKIADGEGLDKYEQLYPRTDAQVVRNPTGSEAVENGLFPTVYEEELRTNHRLVGIEAWARGLSANGVKYDNTLSGLDAADVQAAIDLLATNPPAPEPEKGFVYTVKIDPNNSDPYTRVSYLNDCANFVPGSRVSGLNVWDWGSWRPFVESIFRPCMLNRDGTVAYYLNRDNQNFKVDGTPSDVANTTFNGNAMVEVTRVYTRTETIGGFIYYSVSNIKHEGFVDYLFINENGTSKEVMYMPMFLGTKIATPPEAAPRYGSFASCPIDNDVTGSGEWNAAGGYANGYYPTTWAARLFMQIMHVLIGKSTNSEAVYGYGRRQGAGTSGDANSGAFVRSSYAVKTFYMEDSWGDIIHRLTGLLLEYPSGTTPTAYLTKMSPPFNITGAGYNREGGIPLIAPNRRGYTKTAVASNTIFAALDIDGGENVYFSSTWATQKERSYNPYESYPMTCPARFLSDGIYGITFYNHFNDIDINAAARICYISPL